MLESLYAAKTGRQVSLRWGAVNGMVARNFVARLQAGRPRSRWSKRRSWRGRISSGWVTSGPFYNRRIFALSVGESSRLRRNLSYAAPMGLIDVTGP